MEVLTAHDQKNIWPFDTGEGHEPSYLTYGATMTGRKFPGGSGLKLSLYEQRPIPTKTSFYASKCWARI